MLMFDIGANAGIVTDCFVEQGYHVVAVEPLGYRCDEIKNKHSENDVTVINAAVHYKKGPLDFYTIEEWDVISTLSEEWRIKSRFGLEKSNRIWPTVIKVNCVKIDDLIEQYGIPKLIKIDVEGSEYEALLSHNKKIETVIIFEWTEELIKNTKKCIEHLASLGYTKYRNSCCHIEHEGLDDKNEKIFNENFYRPIEEFEDNIKSCFTTQTGRHDSHIAWGDVYVM